MEDNVATNEYSLDDIEELIAGSEHPAPEASESAPAPGAPPPPPPPPPTGERSRRKPRKAELIAAIEAHEGYSPDAHGGLSKLKSRRVAELEQIYAKLGGAPGPAPAADPAASVGSAAEPTSPGPAAMPAGGQPPPQNAVPIEQLMYFALLNTMVAVESLSHNTSVYTGMEIAGAAEQVRRDEPELRPLLTGVYLEHKPTLQPILTPTALLMTYIARVGAENVKRVDGKKGASPAMSAKAPSGPQP